MRRGGFTGLREQVFGASFLRLFVFFRLLVLFAGFSVREAGFLVLFWLKGHDPEAGFKRFFPLFSALQSVIFGRFWAFLAVFWLFKVNFRSFFKLVLKKPKFWALLTEFLAFLTFFFFFLYDL